MPSVLLCRDGLETALEREDDGYWLVLRDTNEGKDRRFSIDVAELRAIAKGRISFQVSDGEGGSTHIEGEADQVRVRLELRGKGMKQCRFDLSTFVDAINSLGNGV